ncbi:MAG: Dam family site-specific DNA-(adenine-N6)-methyltransferase [Candidatus Tectomicrobia bacterium]|uniref:Site-specific DNA-methyltransferase (adenine-specific) n=1 Tax=Tectimicrobiota bacterium TaxID=2528274 RepID=A0A932MM22_UNCTE|nr:Dam family site-specific DNA-(adenine-N6)-methyltransferase [Candidatus Tectomicrobia bacterium]
MPTRAPQAERPALRPPLKWAGGKRWLVPYLRHIWEGYVGAHGHAPRLVEPLCGGLAVALEIRPRRALLNDINPHVGNFYRWLKRGLVIPEDLEMANDSGLYYAHRARFNELLKEGKETGAEAAALFYYLNRTGYNGLCRFNNSGGFNVPFGRYAKINYARDFTPYRAALRGWRFTSGDFERIPLERGDFVYADPPYDVEFTKYAKEGFGWDDQVRLAGWLARHKGPVVASNQATERIVRLYRKLGFRLAFLEAPRMISCKADGRKRVMEVVGVRG